MTFGSHSKAAEAWASGNYENGKSSAGSTSFRGAAFFSYATQIAERLDTPQGVVYLVGDGSYSNTTAGKHYPAMYAATGYVNIVKVEASPWGGKLPILSGSALQDLLNYYAGLVKEAYERYDKVLSGHNYPTKGKRMEDCLSNMQSHLRDLESASELLDGWEDVTHTAVVGSIQFKTSQHYINEVKARLVDDLDEFRKKRQRLPKKKVALANRRAHEGSTIDSFRKELQTA